MTNTTKLRDDAIVAFSSVMLIKVIQDGLKPDFDAIARDAARLADALVAARNGQEEKPAEAESPWIKLADRKPNTGQRVLVCWSAANPFVVDWRDDIGESFVTHWMPIPPLPK